MVEETSGSMNEPSESQQEALIECLAALEAGTDMEACLARWPEHAESLRPLLEFRAQLLASDVPSASPAAFQAGQVTLFHLLQRIGPLREAGFVGAAGKAEEDVVPTALDGFTVGIHFLVPAGINVVDTVVHAGGHHLLGSS